MRGSIAMEALLISVVAIFLLVFAGNAVQAYGAKFAEDVDRMAWIRQSVYKIYASVQMLRNCGVGSVDTIDVYVPENGEIILSGNKITGNIIGLNRKYSELGGGDEYDYSIAELGAEFKSPETLPQGWARIQLKKITTDKIEVTVIIAGLRKYGD